MVCVLLFFFKQKTAYEMRISDWSSYVCSSDLVANHSTGASRSPHRIATKQPPQTAVIQSMRAGRGRESGRGASSCISAQRPARCARPIASSTTRASGGGTAPPLKPWKPPPACPDRTGGGWGKSGADRGVLGGSRHPKK